MSWMAFTGFLVSCEQPFEPVIPSEPTLAVSATCSPLVDVANPGLGFMVFLTPVLAFSDGPSNAFIENATVELYSGNLYLQTMVSGTIGTRRVYASFIKPEVGKPYTIRITAPGYGTAEASDRLPSVINARIAGYNGLSVTDLPEGKSRVVFNLLLEVSDRPIEDDYYHVFIEYRTKSDPGFRRFFQLSNAENNDPSLTPYLLNQSFLLDGRLFDGETKVVQLACEADLDAGEELLNVQAEVRHASASYYAFHRSQAIQVSNGGSPVVEPTVLFSNVEGGVGFFGAFNPTRDTLTF